MSIRIKSIFKNGENAIVDIGTESITKQDMINEYGAMSFANTIATIPPKVIFNNETIQKLWDEISTQNNIEQINYVLVHNNSKRGCSVLGFFPIKEKLHLLVGELDNVDYDDDGQICGITFKCLANKNSFWYNKIVSSSHGIDSDPYERITGSAEHSLAKKYGFRCGLSKAGSSIDTDTGMYNIDYSIIYDVFPFLLIQNNPLGFDDFYNVDKKIINDFYGTFSILAVDSIIAKGMIYINTGLLTSKTDEINALKKALTSSNQVVFENNGIYSLFETGALQIHQGNSNAQSLLEKFKFYLNQIKDLAFLPKSTLDAGTKNIHGQEAAMINSQSDDYIELKANLLELGWTKLLKTVFLDQIQIIEKYRLQVSDINFHEIDVNVEIAGSTKYLKNKANEYAQTQQGTLINPNNIQGLDETKEQNGEK